MDEYKHDLNLQNIQKIADRTTASQAKLNLLQGWKIAIFMVHH